MTNYIGDLYDGSLGTKGIAARLRKELKPLIAPHKCSVAVPHHSSIDVTVKGVGLVSDDHGLTDEGRRVEAAVEAHAKRYNYHEDWGGGEGSSNSYLGVEVKEAFDRKDVIAEAERLREVYTITDMKTLWETAWSLDLTPLQQEAVNTLEDSFKEKKAKPETSLAVAEEMDRWIEKVKVWFDPGVQYETGPRYYRVVLDTRTVCLVDRKDGTIRKAAYKRAAPNSTRGTVFDGLNVFSKRGLISKDEFARTFRK